MRIAYIMRYWPVYGGGETVTVTLANELINRGHIVHILYTYRNEVNPMPYLLDNKIKEIKLDTVNNSKSNVVAIVNYLKEHQIDIMINQWGDFNLFNNVKKLLGVKLVTCWHMCLISDQIRNQMPHTIKQKLYYKIMGESYYRKWWLKIHASLHHKREKMCDCYVFLSDAYLKEYLKLMGNKSKATNLESISNPLTYNYDYDQRQYGKKKKEVLFVGRILEAHKRLSYVLKIWKEIEADQDLNEWSLRIVGDGPDMEAIQNLSKMLGLQRLSFEGYRDPKPFYEQSSIILMTSAYEGFPMVLVESQQYAVVPIVMDSFDALHDVIQNKRNGIIIKNNDISGFVAGLKELMVNDNLRKQLVQYGLESCKRYNVVKVVDKWETLLNRLIL